MSKMYNRRYKDSTHNVQGKLIGHLLKIINSFHKKQTDQHQIQPILS